jgi:hypothetical protein
MIFLEPRSEVDCLRDSLEVERAMQESLGDENKSRLSDDVLFTFRAHPELNFGVETREHVRQLGAHDRAIVVSVVRVRRFLHEGGLDDDLPAPIDVRPGNLVIPPELGRRASKRADCGISTRLLLP